ncbi:PAS domain-containing protein [Ferrimonas gelatinilytica]|uniref:PAS domain-containing protein n=1 Tax=Ferrimonas gelatinilytica TaxID=1255257 RepID=A0ABP9SFG3_9GAMM
MAQKENSGVGLSNVLAKRRHDPPISLAHPPFSLQLLLLTVVVIGTAYLLLSLNRQMLYERLAAQRFTEMQVFSDRINEALLRQEASVQLISQLPLGQQADDAGTHFTESMLQQMQSNLNRFEALALLDGQGRSLFKAGHSEYLSLTRDEILQQRQQLDPEELFASKLYLDSQRHAAYQWLLVPLPSNPLGAESLLALVNISDLWESFYAVYDIRRLPLFLIDAEGNSLNLTSRETGYQGSIESQFPQLWKQVRQNSFGQYTEAPQHFVYMQVRPDSHSPLYLMTYLDERTDHPVADRYQSQFYLAMLALLVVLARLLWLRRYRQDHQSARLRAEQLAEHLFERDNGTGMFDSAGYCLAANSSLCTQLGMTPEQLNERRFRNLFDSDPMNIDVVWQLARSSGYWQGQLMPRQQDGPPFLVQIRHLKFKGSSSLMLVRLEESLKQQAQQQRVRYLASLGESGCGLALLDTEQNIVECNAAMLQLCAQPKDQLVGLGWQQLLAWHNNEMTQVLSHQLGARGSWQGPLWLRRGDGAVSRCLANIQLNESNDGEDPHWVLALMPLRDPNLPLEAPEQIQKKELLQQRVRQQENGPCSLLVLHQVHASTLNGFTDLDSQLFHQFKMLNVLRPALPADAIVGDEPLPGEIHILLPHWEDSRATRLASNLIKLLRKSERPEDLVIGIASATAPTEWDPLLAKAQAAVERAKLTGQRVCQAYTRHNE